MKDRKRMRKIREKRIEAVDKQISSHEEKIETEKPPKDTTLHDVLHIVKSSIDLSEIIGIYLVGSYARGDNTYTSDIDILIISEKTNRELIKKDGYEILIVSLNLLHYK